MTSTSPRQYLADLSTAEHKNILDWHSPAPDRYELRVGRLVLDVVRNGKVWSWHIIHERSGKLRGGDSEDVNVAGREAIYYAKDLVRQNQLAGLQAL